MRRGSGLVKRIPFALWGNDNYGQSHYSYYFITLCSSARSFSIDTSVKECTYVETLFSHSSENELRAFAELECGCVDRGPKMF